MIENDLSCIHSCPILLYSILFYSRLWFLQVSIHAHLYTFIILFNSFSFIPLKLFGNIEQLWILSAESPADLVRTWVRLQKTSSLAVLGVLLNEGLYQIASDEIRQNKYIFSRILILPYRAVESSSFYFTLLYFSLHLKLF